MSDIKQVKELPTTEEQADAYAEWIYMMHAKDDTARAFEAGYRLGYVLRKEEETLGHE